MTSAACAVAFWGAQSPAPCSEAQCQCAQVIENAREIGETAIGYIEEDGTLNLSPKKADTSSFNEHSRIVAIAEQM